MARLKLLKGGAKWSECELGTGKEVIGRDRNASIVLHDPSFTVSRMHASIHHDGGRYYISDHSKSGTFLNGRRLVRERRYPLEAGGLIQMCGHALVFLDDTESVEEESSVHISGEGAAKLTRFVGLSASDRDEWSSVNAESKLAALMELTQNLRSCNSLESLLGNSVDTLLKLFTQADRGLVILDPLSAQPRIVATRERGDIGDLSSVVSAGLVDQIATGRAAALSDDELTIGAPLISDDEQTLGVVLLQARGPGGSFSGDDLDLFATISVFLAISVENRVLNEAALRSRDLQYELNVANEVQFGLLPAEPPRKSDYEFFDYYSPASHVGGDYYDYIELDEHRLAIVLGDVSGKGVPAALLMSKVANELNMLLTDGVDPTAAIQRVNTRLASRNPRGAFVTMLLAVLDASCHEVSLVNAGHFSPLLRQSSGEVIEVGHQQSGFPLGIRPEHRYAEMSVSLSPGESLVLYSDGILDAQDTEEARYGRSRLKSRVADGTPAADALGERILRDLHSFVGTAEQFDDICLLCVARGPDGNNPGVPEH